VLLKVICAELAQPASTSDINQYQPVIFKQFPNFGYFRVLIRPMGQSALPWLKWRPKSKRHPGWWGSSNKVKHQRNLYFAQANLQNVLLPRRVSTSRFSLGIISNLMDDTDSRRFTHSTFDGDMKELIMKRAQF
jgi:hypothetical protein